MARFVRNHPLRVILFLGLLHGLLYVFLVPPWQHNDEPTQFEYAWLLANRPGLPQPGEYDQTMRRAVALSMIEHNFFRGMSFLPDLNVQSQPVWIGVSQLDGRPFYYLLASLPLRMIKSWDVTRQLFAARLVSLSLYLLTLLAAWGIMKEVLSEDSPLRWLVPLSMVLMPGYVNLMTAVTDDVGATAIFSIFLWGSVCMIRRGFSWPRLAWVAATAALCLWTKQTVYFALPLFGLVLLFSLLRHRWRWVPWALTGVSILGLIFSTFSWGGDASFWVRFPDILHNHPTRSLSAEAPLGKYALEIVTTPNEPWHSVFQQLPQNQVSLLSGKKVTLGAWIWATRPLTIDNGLIIYDGHEYFSQKVQIGTSPRFFTLTATLARDANRVQVIFVSGGQGNQGTWTVFYDGLVLVEGAFPLDAVPQFDNVQAQRGEWGGQAFTNLLRNGSVESADPGFRPWAEKIRSKFLPAIPSPSLVLDSLLDRQGEGWYYLATAQKLLRTFWAEFGWEHVFLNLPFAHQPYIPLAIFTLAGLGGAGIALWRQRVTLPWNVLLVLGIALAGIWGQALLRGIGTVTGDHVFVPGARYAYPVIIPSLLMLNAGWLQITQYIERWTRLPSVAKFLVYCLLFLCLDIAAVYTLIHYYYI